MIDFDQANKLSDEELVVLTLKNRDYFLFIINRYKVRLFNYIRRMTVVNIDDAEDILQEVFIKVYLNLNGFDTDLKFSSWIYAIARNQVISNHRKFQARAMDRTISLDDEDAKKISLDLNNIEEDIDKKFLKNNIAEVLDEIPEKYKEVLVLKFLEERNYQEISDIIKKPTGTVGSMINKAKQILKIKLRI